MRNVNLSYKILLVSILSLNILCFQNIYSQNKLDEYEVKIFVSDTYPTKINKELFKLLQSNFDYIKVKYKWFIVNSDFKKYELLKNSGDLDKFKNINLDIENQEFNKYNLNKPQYIVLTKNGKEIHKTDNFVFNETYNILSFIKNNKFVERIEMQDKNSLNDFNTFTFKNIIFIIDPENNVNLYGKYNCDENKLSKFEQFDFNNKEIENLFSKLNFSKITDKNEISNVYFSGIIRFEGYSFAYTFRDISPDSKGIIKYYLFVYDENNKFVKKVEYSIFDNLNNDQILKTEFIENNSYEIQIGIKWKNSGYSISTLKSN